MSGINNAMSLPIARRVFLIIGLLAALPMWGNLNQLHAQIQVNFKLDKKVYMTHEAVSGQLVIVNRAGRDLILEGNNSASWLDFQVTDRAGNLVTPVQGRAGLESVLIRAGKTLNKKVYVNRRYPMGQPGIYRIRANVYFAPLKRYFQTKIQSIQITNGAELWSQVVGVPAEFAQDGSYRKYSVLRFDQQGRKEIYFRLSRAESGLVMTTYSLGRLLMVTDPAMGVDTNNRLHVLHMGAPQSYAHTTINVDGKPKPQEFFFAKGENRPRLVRAANGDIVVEGGIPADKDDSVYEKNEFRMLSELPPGMPLP
jgi:hypothetical protein